MASASIFATTMPQAGHESQSYPQLANNLFLWEVTFWAGFDFFTGPTARDTSR
jgi:hypothetical protein